MAGRNFFHSVSLSFHMTRGIAFIVELICETTLYNTSYVQTITNMALAMDEQIISHTN